MREVATVFAAAFVVGGLQGLSDGDDRQAVAAGVAAIVSALLAIAWAPQGSEQ